MAPVPTQGKCSLFWEGPLPHPLDLPSLWGSLPASVLPLVCLGPEGDQQASRTGTACSPEAPFGHNPVNSVSLLPPHPAPLPYVAFFQETESLAQPRPSPRLPWLQEPPGLASYLLYTCHGLGLSSKGP